MVDVLQHCFGRPNAGGPATALGRLLGASQRQYPTVWQHRAAGGISPSLLRELAGEIRRHRPRLIHVRGLGNEGFHAALAARIAGVPKILVSVHGTHRDLVAPPSPLRTAVVSRVLEPATLYMADAIVTVCESAARRSFLDPHRSKLLPPVGNGVVLPELSPVIREDVRAGLGIASDRLVGITVGRLTREKGIGDLAEALRGLEKTGVEMDVLVVGGGPDEAELRSAFADLRLVRVHFLGQRDDVERLLQASDVFLFPTWSENLSNALLEAMAHRLAVVATDVGGNTEVLAKGGGVLVPAHAPAAFADALGALIADRPRLRRLAEAARQTIERHYTIDCMVRGWEQTYDRLLKGTS